MVIFYFFIPCVAYINHVLIFVIRKLFNLLKEKRSNLDDRWLSNMYAHIAYIVIINTEEFANILTSKIGGESLLHIACMNFPESPIVARYIAEVMVKLNIIVNEVCNYVIRVFFAKYFQTIISFFLVGILVWVFNVNIS